MITTMLQRIKVMATNMLKNRFRWRRCSQRMNLMMTKMFTRNIDFNDKDVHKMFINNS